MKKTPFVLLCFLFVGPTPPDEVLTVSLASKVTYSNVSLHRLEGDGLVATFDGDTIVIPIEEISEISSRSLVLGFSGCWFGTLVGALTGAACAGAMEPIEGPSGGEMSKGSQMAFGALLWGGVGAIGGCISFPEDEQRFLLGDMTLDQKRSTLVSILRQYGIRHD